MDLAQWFNPRDARGVLFIALTAFTLCYLAILARVVIATRRGASEPGLQDRAPTLERIATGAVTNFFDTLGIGSFATTTSVWEARTVGTRDGGT